MGGPERAAHVGARGRSGEDGRWLRLDLPHELRSIAVARRAVGALCGDFGGDLRRDVELCVSELVANAVLHARSAVHLEANVRVGMVRIEVHDDSTVAPVVLEPSHDRAHGRGLSIVVALARDWGWEPVPGGKVVWAELGGAPGRR